MRFLLALFTAALPAAHAAPEINQSNAMAEVAKLNQAAVTNSLQASMLNAMRSYTSVLQAQPGGAYSNAMRSVSQFTNAERLEHLKFMNEKLEASMNSDRGGKSIAQSLVGLKLPNVSYRQLDPSFLRHGEAKEVAEKFEAASGLKREQFFRHLSDLSEQKSFGGLTVSAMQLAKSQLTTFVKNMGGDKAGAVLGFLAPISPAEGVQIFSAEVKKAQAAGSVVKAAPVPSVDAKREPASAVAAPAQSEATAPIAAAREPASPIASQPERGAFGTLSGTQQTRSEELAVEVFRQGDDVFQLAGASVDADDIFRRVRERYRLLQRDHLVE